MLPPLLVELGRRFRYGGTAEWEYIPQGWTYAETHPEVKGWNVPDVLEVYQRKWPGFVSMVQGTGPLGIAHEADLGSNTDIYNHNTIMAFGYVLALVARRTDTLSMLDWGGGIGHYYLLAQSLLPNVQIKYHCKDVPILAEYGRQLFPDQYFYSDKSCLERKYDFVLASTSIHYTEDWQSLLAGLAEATQHYLYITRLPTVLHTPSYVFVQRAYAYNTEYLGWCLNRDRLLSEAEKIGLELIREFVIAETPSILYAPEQCQYRGFLFQPSA